MILLLLDTLFSHSLRIDNMCLIFFNIVGVFAGSFIVRALKIEESGRKSAFLCLIFQLFSIIGPLALLMPGCKEINLAGLEVPYGKRLVGKKYKS